jgi:thymidylate kinase
VKYPVLALLCGIALPLALSARDAAWLAIPAFALLLGAAVLALLWPNLDDRAARAPMAPLIALVGCDGSGKSTLGPDILREVLRTRPAALCYLGLGSGELGNRIRAWPLIGPAVERRLAAKAGQTRTTGEKIPGLATALVVYGFSMLRYRRFRRVLALRRAGTTVIADRYPQTDVAGFYDGPGLSAARAGSRVVAALAAQEYRMYRWMAGFHPDIVIRLDISLATAFARKPDHGYDLLRRKVEATPLLRFDGAPIMPIDAEQPYEKVRAAVLQAVRASLDGHRR